MATFTRGVRALAEHLQDSTEMSNAGRVPRSPPPFAELTHVDALAPEWVPLDGSGVHVDRAGVLLRETGIIVWLRRRFDPPRLDRETDRPVAELWTCEEHDLDAERFRRLRVVFRYADQTHAERTEAPGEWCDAADP